MTWPFDHLLIRASAGTGKTYQLTSRYIALIHRGVKPEKALASTFTRKAAGEILDRVMHRLAAAAVDPEECDDLARAVRDPGFTRQRALQLAGELARTLHRLRICTLDSLFAAMSGSFSLELGLPPVWRIAEETADRRLRRQAIRAVLEQEPLQEMIALLRLINSDYASRTVSDSLQDKITSVYSLYCESQREAWFHLDRLKQLGQDEIVRLLQEAGDPPLARNKDGSITKSWFESHQAICHMAMAGDWKQLLSQGITSSIAKGKDKFDRKPITDEVADYYRPLVDQARAVMLNRRADETEALWKLMSRFDAVYSQLKIRQGLLRFEDVTRRLAEAGLNDRADELYYRLDATIEHLLLDEFQDTSLTQWKVIRPMAKEIASDSTRDRSSLYVGDVKQAIYGWRGGEAAIFDMLNRDVSNLEPQTLDESRRSAQPVINCVNQVFMNLPGNPSLDQYPDEAARWNQQFIKHSTHKKEYSGYVQLSVAPQAGENDKQDVVTLQNAADLVRELAAAAPGRTIGVLVRQNNHQQIARLIYEIGRDDPKKKLKGVRASEEGGNPLSDSVAVEMALAAIRMADHPGDTTTRFHLAASRLGEILKFTDADSDAKARTKAAEIRTALLREGYGPLLHRWARQLGVFGDAHEQTRLMQLVEIGYQYDAEPTLRPADFVEYVEAQKVEDPTSSPVRVMTIHASKGLQFDAVVLPQLSGVELTGGRNPHMAVQKDPQTLEINRVVRWINKDLAAVLPEISGVIDEQRHRAIRESLCGLYVAMTRAKHGLYMIVDPAEKTQGKNYGHLLINALASGKPADPGVVLYESKSSKSWWLPGDPSEPTEDHRWLELPQPKLASSEHRHRMLPRRSPSGAEGGTKVDLSLKLRLEGAGARQRGTAIHALFELIQWSEDGLPDNAAMRRAIGGKAETGQSGAWIEQFRKMAGREPIARALSRAAYPADVKLTVLREEPFVLRLESGLLNGKIDRLVLMERDGKIVGAEVLDFKTDTLEGRTIEKIIAEYRPQIAEYRAAVGRMYGLDPAAVGGKLLLVAAGQVVDLGSEPV